MDHFYDQIYADKDYGKETEGLESIIQSLAPSARTLLDVACGTGKHLSYLEEKFECQGVDINPRMVEVARTRLKAPVHVGDMTDFNLNCKFDVILCLFGSIAYNLNYDCLLKTIKNLKGHLKENGLLIVEPFVYAENLREGVYRRSVGQMSIESLVSIESEICVLKKTYQLPSETRQGEYRLGLYTEHQYESAFIESGLTSQKIPYPAGNFQVLHIGKPFS